MKRIVLIVTAIFLCIVGLLTGAAFAWAIWVLATGGSWFLEFIFDTGFLTIVSLTLSSGLAAFLSFWGARKRIRGSRGTVQAA